jgi:hypothetical protein
MEQVGLIAALSVALVTVATFLVARAKDAEERGAQRQRILDLERRQDSLEVKIDRIFDKLEEIHKTVSGSGFCK